MIAPVIYILFFSGPALKHLVVIFLPILVSLVFLLLRSCLFVIARQDPSRTFRLQVRFPGTNQSVTLVLVYFHEA